MRLFLRSAILAFMSSAVAGAGDFVGLDPVNNSLFEIGTSPGSALLSGTIMNPPTFGFNAIERGPDGTLYALAPGAASGFSIYTISEAPHVATLLHAVTSTQKGTVGIAIDPTGSKAWVAGFVGLSLIVKFTEVDLSTGATVEKGSLVGSVWGLAFDVNGELYTTVESFGKPRLLKVNQANVAASVPVGTDLGNFDISQGLDLSSDRGTGQIHAFARASDTIYDVSTITGAASNPVVIPGIADVWSIAETGVCVGSSIPYGAGCPGLGGNIPIYAVKGCPSVGSQITFELTQGLGGSTAILFFGLTPVGIPVGGGCTFHVGVLAPFTLSVPLVGVGPGAGSFAFSTGLPAGINPIVITTQAWVLDASTVLGASSSNAVQLVIGP